MTSVEYLVVTCKKAMEKAIIEVIKEKTIRETCHKEKEENRVRKYGTYFNANE
jgi:hypothetical protein